MRDVEVLGFYFLSFLFTPTCTSWLDIIFSRLKLLAGVLLLVAA